MESIATMNSPFILAFDGTIKEVRAKTLHYNRSKFHEFRYTVEGDSINFVAVGDDLIFHMYFESEDEVKNRLYRSIWHGKTVWRISGSGKVKVYEIDADHYCLTEKEEMEFTDASAALAHNVWPMTKNKLARAV